MDNFKNNAFVTVSTGYNAAATTIVLIGGDGLRLPTVPFNAEWYDSTVYSRPSLDPNREIVRVTAIATDTLTITRAQEGDSASTKNTSGSTYKLIAGLTATTLNTHTGTGQLVLDTSPTITTPTIADLTNSTHSHQNAAGGGALSAAAITSGTIAAAQMPALTGDVTTSAGAVATTIANDAVTNAKAANMAAGTVKGRASTAGTGDPTDITALPFADTGDVTRPVDSVVTTIAAGTVTLAKMANMATDSIIGRATASTGVPEVLTALPWADTGDVTRAADGAATTIAANAVTLAKMATIAQGTIIGGAAGAGTATPTALTAVPFTVSIATGGTGATTASAAFTALMVNQGTTTTVLHGNASGNPAWSAVSLTADVSGTLPVANGGTGLTAVPGATTQIFYNSSGAFAGSANMTYDGSGLATLLTAPAANTAPTQGLEVKDSTPASSGNQQYSGGIFWEGQGWKTTATNASQSVRFRAYVVPVQGSTAPTGNLTFDSSINGGAFGSIISFSSAGILTASGAASCTSYGVTGKSRIDSSVNGAIEFNNNGFSARATAQHGDAPIVNKTGNYTVVALDNGTKFGNVGAAGTVILTLPTSAVGQKFYFFVYAAQTLTVTAAGSETIRYGATVSAGGGNISSNAKGCVLCLFCPVAGEWFVDYLSGTWTGPT